MTMTAGSAVVAEDSPAAFGNLHAYKDEIVPWLESSWQLPPSCAVMIQLTHLGRRTNWNKADWLPVLAPSPVREPAHRAFPKEAEDWDLDRIIRGYAAATARMQAAGLDGVELEAYGHLLDHFWSPRPTGGRTMPAAISITDCASPSGCSGRSATRSGGTSSRACASSP